MKVKELIALLQEMPQEQPVFLANIVGDYMGRYNMIEEPQAIFQKEGCTILSLDAEQYIVKYMDASDTFMLKEASFNSKGVNLC